MSALSTSMKENFSAKGKHQGTNAKCSSVFTQGALLTVVTWSQMDFEQCGLHYYISVVCQGDY